MADPQRRARVPEALGLLAAAGIGATRLAYEEFYRSLGTTVDEVGLSNWQMVTISAAVLLAFAPLALVAVFLGVAAARLVKQKVVQIYVGVFVGWLAIVLGTVLIGRFTSSILLPLLTVIGAGTVVLALARPDIVDRRSQLRLTVRWFLFLAGGTVLLMWAFCFTGAGDSARSLREDGIRAKGVTFLLDVAVRPVCVKLPPPALPWAVEAVPTDRPLLLLGIGSRQIVLRDARNSRTLFLPADSTVLESGASPSC